MSALALTCGNVLDGLKLSLPAKAVFAPLRLLEGRKGDLVWDKSDLKTARAWVVEGVSDFFGGRVARTVQSGLKKLLASCGLSKDQEPPLIVLYQSGNPVRFDRCSGKTPWHPSFETDHAEWLDAIDATGAFEKKPGKDLQRWALGKARGVGVFLLMCPKRIQTIAEGALESALVRSKIDFNHTAHKGKSDSFKEDMGDVNELLEEVKKMSGGMKIFDQLEKLFRRKNVREEMSEGEFCAHFPGEERLASIAFLKFLADNTFELLGWEPPKRRVEQADAGGRLWLDGMLPGEQKNMEGFPRRWSWEQLLEQRADASVTCISMRACLLEERDCVNLAELLGKYENVRDLDLSGNCFSPSVGVLKWLREVCRKIRVVAKDNFWDEKNKDMSDAEMAELLRLIEH